MNIKEARMLHDHDRAMALILARLDALESRVEGLSDALTALHNRGRGRPSEAERQAISNALQKAAENGREAH